MPNLRYQRGRSKEQRVVQRLKAEGYLAVRSAGSHSEVDVIGIHPEKKEIVLIQCKPHSMLLKDGQLNAEGKRISQSLQRFEGEYMLKVRVETTRKFTRQEIKAI